MSENVMPHIFETPTISLVAAGNALGMSRTATYAMFNAGVFPLPVIKVGEKMGKARVPTAALLRMLELDIEVDRPSAETVIKRLIADPEVSASERNRLAAMLIDAPE
jgi:predicted DNA-binding transcriptional regulator AlpA